MVEFLLANGADVHQPNDVGARPLHIAARSKAQNSDQIMKFLIAAGAAVNVRNIFGNDAISLCGRDPVNREILLSGDAPLSFSTFALQHRPSPFGDFISILDTDAFVLLARHGIDPTSDNGLGAIPAHAAMAQAKVASLLLNGDYGMTELASPRIDFAHPIESSWLGSAFRLYRRRIPEARFKRVLESPVFHGCTCLYWAAYVGSSQAIANILSAGIPADGKGDRRAVKVLVRHGAKLLFWDADREISAIDLARESAEVVRWLLVLRHTEQNKIQAAGAEVPGNRGAEEVPVRAWSGVTKREIWTAYHRRQNESLREYLIRLSQMKAELRGKPAPPLSRRSRIDQDWDRPKMITDGALHTSMDLKNNVEEWTRGYYNREEWWREYYSTEENDSGSESGSWE
ncbi:unnamed protein product [Parascedosporium putredinis]|uniref:Ankyrin n=1 Tax=Parascedosporium putredinis TaxID=1442378 RepID=A0A9P1H396_9PEZI|nr:unnamed protein product [Parascedosporium putredinis]CAI7994344.1 unnamed protein product [Parascedosporium putredinis]